MRRSLSLITAIALLALATRSEAVPPDAKSLVSAWLAAQTNVQTWSAEVIQIRTLKTLRQPLKASGQVWFAAPDRFRWELGSPPQTIAVRAQTELLLVYPRLKRVERFSLTANQAGPWQEALALLEAGFPRSRAELQARYELIRESVTGTTCTLALQPRSASGKRMIPRIEIDFDTGDFSLLATELHFGDGSTMRNEFRNAQQNPKLDEGLFNPEIPDNYRIVEPLKIR